MKALNCPNCGASFPAQSTQTDIAACEFCGTTFYIPKTLTPESGMGDLLLSADFSSKVMPGWEVIDEDNVSFHKGHPSELRGKFSARWNSYYVLASSGLLDNFDISVNIRFIAGQKEFIRAGFYTRMNNEGGYSFQVSALASYTFHAFVKDDKGELTFQDIMPWTRHAALRPGLNVNNRLRVICNRERFRIYLNGTLAASYTDSRWSMGRLYLAAVPSEKSDMEVAFSDLQLREAPK